MVNTCVLYFETICSALECRFKNGYSNTSSKYSGGALHLLLPWVGNIFTAEFTTLNAPAVMSRRLY